MSLTGLSLAAVYASFLGFRCNGEKLILRVLCCIFKGPTVPQHRIWEACPSRNVHARTRSIASGFAQPRAEGPGGRSAGLWRQGGRVPLTKKLLSLGLVARLRPRRMLSFRSETLDRVTLPGVGGRSSACSPLQPTLCPGLLLLPATRATCGRVRATHSPPRFSLHVGVALHGLLRFAQTWCNYFLSAPCETRKMRLRKDKQPD